MITVKSSIKATIEKAWDCWTNPEHITKWCQASDDWHAPFAENNLVVGEKFKTTMSAKDGSVSFDFEGEYTEIKTHEVIKYTMADGRQVFIQFQQEGKNINIVEMFDPENENSEEMQKAGWQSILDSFKRYVESN